MNTILKFAKVRPSAVIPTKRAEDAGYDLYANFEEPYIVISPHTTEQIPTGIAYACDKNFCLLLTERSSTGTLGIAQRSGVFDSGFRGEITVALTNTTDKRCFIAKKDAFEFIYRGKVVTECDWHYIQHSKSDYYYCGDVHIENNHVFKLSDIIILPYEKAISQLLLLPVPVVEVQEISYEELLAIPSERGLGRCGSSGK